MLYFQIHFFFKSPTCTEKDIVAAKELAEIVEVDYKKYGMDMLIAGTSLGDKTPMEIITLDMKEFKNGGLACFHSSGKHC